MGYAFRCADGTGVNLSLTDREMFEVREVLRLAADMAGAGLPMNKFESNDDWLVTPEECREIVRLIGGDEGEHRVADYQTYTDAPPGGPLLDSVRDLAALAAQAADHGGLRVY